MGGGGGGGGGVAYPPLYKHTLSTTSIIYIYSVYQQDGKYKKGQAIFH